MKTKQKRVVYNIVRRAKALLALLILMGFTLASAQAQEQKAPKKSAADSAKNAEAMTAMLDNSRPGSYHALLEPLAGSWNFKDARLSFVKGTLVRKPMYDGRFYSVEITGGKLQLPVANGKMKEGAYQGMQIEGYDNPKMKFVTISINNHIGSDIEMQTGIYDAVKKEFVYDYSGELIKGIVKKNRRILKIVDAEHYTEEFYEERDGKYVKVRELDYTRLTGQ